MKRLLITSLCLLFLAAYIPVHAQLSKQERKEWKKKAKEYKRNPEQLKDLVEENSSLNGQVTSLKGQVASLQSRASDKDARISELEDELNRAKSAMSNCESQRKQLQAQLESAPPQGNWKQGVVFKVQIGAFNNKDLSDYFANNEIFGGETAEDGTQKITLGLFRDYWRADTFKKYLREMGVKDAWITPFRDGQRVPIKEVLENVEPKPES